MPKLKKARPADPVKVRQLAQQCIRKMLGEGSLYAGVLENAGGEFIALENYFASTTSAHLTGDALERDSAQEAAFAVGFELGRALGGLR